MGAGEGSSTLFVVARCRNSESVVRDVLYESTT